MDDKLKSAAEQYATITLKNGEKAYDATRDMDFTNGALWGRRHIGKQTVERVLELSEQWTLNDGDMFEFIIKHL